MLNERKLSSRVLWTQSAYMFASQSVWLLNSYFLLYFYTDVVQVPAAVATVVLLVTRVWDAVNDPLMGIICDETHASEGKARIWLKRMFVPAGLLVALSYCCPEFVEGGKALWVAFTYVMQDLALTMVGVPANTLKATMTSDRIERVRLSQFGAVAMFIASYVVPSITMPFVRTIGGGNERIGFAAFSLMLGIVYSLTTYLVYWGSAGFDPSTSTPEANDDAAEKGRVHNALALVKTALQNKYCLLAMLTNIFYLILAGIMTSTLIYYFRYNLGNEDLMSPYSLVLTVTSFISIFLLRVLCKRLGNALTCIIGGALCIAGFIPRLLGADSVLPLFFVCVAVLGVGSGIVSNAMSQCILDATTYGRIHTGESNESITMSLYTFAQKLGNAAGTVIASTVLAVFGYEAGQEVTETIKAVFFAENIIVPMVIATIMIAILLVLHKMEKQLVKDIAAEKAQEAVAVQEGCELA